MKKIIMLVVCAVAAVSAWAQAPQENVCAGTGSCCAVCDSVNMPVFIVDGVEVRTLDDLSADDIVKIEVVKSPEVTRIFSPRLGGVVLVTTKSKKYLRPLLQEYEALSEQQRRQRIPGELRIR